MKGKDNIKDLFSEKLGNFEAPVKPELWSGISSQIGASAAQTAAGGMTILTKTLIGLGIVAATVVTAVLVTSNNEPEKEPAQEKKIVQTDTQEEIKNNDSEELPTIESAEDKSTSTPDLPGEETETPEVYPLYESLPVIQMPVEEFEERVTQEDEPVIEITEGPNEQSSPTEDGPIDEKVVSEPTETSKEEIVTEEPAVSEVEIVLPNTFTPNNDNKNDFYEIMEGAEELEDFSVFIYNMSGEIVFRSDDPFFKWNGQNLMHEAVPQGRYMCVLIATDKAGNPRKITKQFDLFK